MKIRWNWGVVALVMVLAAAAALLATGRLQFHWRPDAAAERHGHAHDGDEKQADEEEGRVSGDKAVFDAEALRAAAFRTAAAEKGSVGVLLQVTGEVRVPDERMAQVTPRVSGVVREIHKARGEPITQGGPLAVIESTDLGEAKAAYVTAVADLRIADRNAAYWARPSPNGGTGPSAGGWLDLDQALAEQGAAQTESTLASRTLARVKELHDRGLRSRTELLAAEADERRAAARVEAAARRLEVLRTMADTERARAQQRRDAALSKLRALSVEPAVLTRLEREGVRDMTSRFVVRSPIAGTVAERNVTIGETVEATAKIFSIADLSEVWITAALFDKDLAIVRQGMPATVRVQGLADATFEGRVKQIGPQVDEKTRTLPVRIAVANRPFPGAGTERYALRPGMFATADLETSRRAGAVVVPLPAIQTVSGQSVVFVETLLSEGAVFQRRAVVLGARDARVVEVVQGLEAGERVVVTNSYLLKSEFERSKISHGHAH
jgi:cobalt-zinc-cadmium efflux system membrane fusion protein